MRYGLVLGSVAALFATMAGVAPAQAGMAMEVDAVCAVGGEKFTYTTTPSYTIFGKRPDGKPYGSWTFPLELPICPGNGIVMYDDFSDAEKAALPDILASEAFAAVRQTDTDYYRAMWLSRALGRDVAEQRNLLYVAIWETDGREDLRCRYFGEYLAMAKPFPMDSFMESDVWEELSYANAERELGRFDDAIARLDRIAIANAKDEDGNPLAETADLVEGISMLRKAAERRDANPMTLEGKDAPMPSLCAQR